MRKYLPYLALLVVISTAARADDVTETLANALEAYEAGDIKYALEEIAYAEQLLKDMQAGELEAFLPPAPEGWSRETDEGAAAGFGMIGGTGVAATYRNEAGSQNEQFTFTIMMDSPMVAGMAGLFGNAAMMGSQGKMVRVGREKFLEQQDKLMGLIDGRVLIQVEGGQSEMVIPMLESMDLRALGRFGL